LAAKPQRNLAMAKPFTPETIREDLPATRVRTSALPWVVMLAILLMLGGGVLRRI
jgi:hypothetical protein